MVHCQNFPKSLDIIKKLLDNTITPYLVKVMAQHHITMDPASLKWVNDSNVFAWKVVVENADVANILCTKVVSLEVRCPDGNGSISFKSGFHMMAPHDLKQYFSQLMITDLPRENFATTTSASSSGPSTASAPSSGVCHQLPRQHHQQHHLIGTMSLRCPALANSLDETKLSGVQRCMLVLHSSTV